MLAATAALPAGCQTYRASATHAAAAAAPPAKRQALQCSGGSGSKQRRRPQCSAELTVPTLPAACTLDALLHAGMRKGRTAGTQPAHAPSMRWSSATERGGAGAWPAFQPPRSSHLFSVSDPFLLSTPSPARGAPASEKACSAPLPSPAAMSGKWAMRNPAVKRIMQELREMEKEDSPDLLAEAIEVRPGRL